MTNNDYLDGKVEGLVPYRGLPDDMIEINKKQYLIAPEQRKELAGYNQGITDLEKGSLKNDSIKISKDFGSGAVTGFAIGGVPVALLSAGADFLQFKDSVYNLVMTGGLLTLAALCFSTGISYVIGRCLDRKNTKRQELIEIKNKRQNLLEELVK